MPLLLLLAGCGTYGLENGRDSLPESDSVAVLPCNGMCITAIEPATGPLAGGTSVQILGEGFGLDPQVFFGNLELNSTVLGSGQLLVTSPAVPVAGPVDVKVVNGVEETVAYQGYYFGSGGGGGDTGGDSDTGSDVTPTGLTEGLVEYSYLVYGCPECFGAPNSLEFSIAAAFHDPVNDSWLDDLPPQGSCETTSVATLPAYSYKDVGTWAYIIAGSTSVGLQHGSNGVYVSSALGVDDKLWNSAYDLQVPDAGWLVQDVMETTSGFDDIQPISILNPSPSAFANMSRNDVTFGWAPSGQAESFLIWLTIYNASGSSVLGEVYCHAQDNGGATLPAYLFTAYPSGALMSIQLSRVQGSKQVNPSTGNTVEGASYIGLFGTATLR